MSRAADSQDYYESAKRFLAIVLIISAAVLLLVITVIEAFYVSQPSPAKVVQSIAVHVLTSIIAFTAAYFALSRFNDLKQQRLIQQGLSASFVDLRGQIRSVHGSVIEAGTWRDNFIRINDIPYPKLFQGAKKVGLVVQGWDRWPEDRIAELREFVAGGGEVTVVLHDPDNQAVVAAMRSRWTQTKNCEDEIRNTEGNFRREIHPTHHDKMHFVYHDAVIWYCMLRFEYEHPDETVFIVSPYAHKDFSVNNIPAFLVRSGGFPHLLDFLSSEWTFLSTPRTQPSPLGPQPAAVQNAQT